MIAYYNDIDPFVCDWLEELIADGQITPGDVDRRSIADVAPEDLAGYDRVHFFAGIGGWDLALTWAGWPDDVTVWTGSCPCQPFSSAGKRLGTDDERHLWPAFFRLISERRPPVVFGEQVASLDGCEWLAGVRADLERAGYAVGAADLCAAGVEAPHIRQRLYWVADATIARSARSEDGRDQGEATGRRRVLEPERIGHDGRRLGLAAVERDGAASVGGGVGGGADAGRIGERGGSGGGDHWSDCGLVRCIEPTRDGGTVERWRRAPVEPALFPLADGFSGRMGVLRGAGNAIVPQVAAAFVRAYMGSEALA